MTRYSDGLLPGHVYMLYWIDKQNRKRIPSYFEYTYGINFYKEKNFLEDKGYIIDDKITELGKKAITSHYEVIEAKHPKPKNTGNASKSIIEFSNCGRKISIPFSNGRLRVPISDKPVILREIQQLNQAIELAKRLSGIKANLAIDGNELCFTDPKMFYEFHNLTPKGRETKSPLTLHYVCSGHNDANSPKDYFGEISYARDGKIYSAKLIFWKYKKGYMIHIGTNKNQTLIKKVEISENFKWIVKYKCV